MKCGIGVGDVVVGEEVCFMFLVMRVVFFDVVVGEDCLVVK